MERQQIAALRPKLIVRWAEGIIRSPEGKPFVAFHVENVGGSDARPIISAYSADIFSSKNLPPPTVITNVDDFSPPNVSGFLEKKTIRPQEGRAVGKFAGSIKTAGELTALQEQWNVDPTIDRHWILHGIIVYEDIHGTRYRTNFWREFNFDARRFVAITDPEYEYQT